MNCTIGGFQEFICVFLVLILLYKEGSGRFLLLFKLDLIKLALNRKEKTGRYRKEKFKAGII